MCVIPNFITAFVTDSRPDIYGDGEQTRDFTHVDNIVLANRLAMTASGVSGLVFNVACGEQISLNRLLGSLESHRAANER